MPKALNARAAEALYARLAAKDLAPETELDFKNPFTLLVAVVLSAQATDAGVNKATGPLFAIADTPQKMAALGEARLSDFIKTIGLWRGKAKNVIALSQILLDRHGGEVPVSRAELEALPGVGRKTANVVLNAAFGEGTIAVDTHVFRVANRTGLAPGKTPLEVEEGLLKITPGRYLKHAHHWLILHGRYVCVARKPKCASCAISDLCLFTEKAIASGDSPPRPRGREGGAPLHESRSLRRATRPSPSPARLAEALPPTPPSQARGGSLAAGDGAKRAKRRGAP
jgi:endonuclease-3